MLFRSNVFVCDAKPGKDATVKLIDFGQSCKNGTVKERIQGTPDYIAPEQAEDSNNIDQTADIYSLGCTFYVALTGRVPFPQKKNAEKLAGHRAGRYSYRPANAARVHRSFGAGQIPPRRHLLGEPG